MLLHQGAKGCMKFRAPVDLRRSRARHESRRQAQLLGMRRSSAWAKGDGAAEKAALRQVAS
eukprot:1428111-Alexandrium_andersonii.AAC.1